MAFQVDQCKNFKDGKKCSKCERMMPAYCKDQQELEDKARKYDEWVASQQIVGTETVVVEDQDDGLRNEADEAPVAKEVTADADVVELGDSGRKPQNAPKPKGYARGRRK